MNTPIEDCFLMMTKEITALVTWLGRYQLFGVPIIGYLLAIAVTGLAIDYIFG